MKSFVLYRYDYGIDNTLGLFFAENEYLCDTLELPWKDNQKNISCIPEGYYLINAVSTPHFDEAILINNVFNREGILIHAANEVKELQGCIAVGIKSVEILLQSRSNLSKILDILGTETGTLNIKRM